MRRAMGEEYWYLFQNEVRVGVEELRFDKMVALGQQGAWTRWDGV